MWHNKSSERNWSSDQRQRKLKPTVLLTITTVSCAGYISNIHEPFEFMIPTTHGVVQKLLALYITRNKVGSTEYSLLVSVKQGFYGITHFLYGAISRERFWVHWVLEKTANWHTQYFASVALEGALPGHSKSVCYVTSVIWPWTFYRKAWNINIWGLGLEICACWPGREGLWKKILSSCMPGSLESSAFGALSLFKAKMQAILVLTALINTLNLQTAFFFASRGKQIQAKLN